MRVYLSRLIFSGLRIFFCLALWSVPVVYLIYSLAIVQFVRSHDQAWLLQWYSRTWPEGFDAETISRDCMTGKWHDWIQTHGLWIMALTALALLLYLIFWRKVTRFIDGSLGEMVRVIRFGVDSFMGCNPKEKVGVSALFGGILAYRIYLWAAFPLHADEVTSYLYFVRQGFRLTMISYPIPNNHILLNLLCGILYKTGFLSVEFVMRLPSLIADFLLFYGIFCLFRRWGGFRRAIIVVAGVAFCHILSLYAIQGRGYQLQVLCAVVSGVSCWAYFFSGEWAGRSGYPLFVLSSVAGFYINPLFVYHFLALILLCCYVFVRGRQFGELAVFVRGVGTIVVLTAILYLPLILGSSWEAITDNRYVSMGRPWHNLADDFWILVYDIKYDFYYGVGSVYLLTGGILVSAFLYFSHRLSGRYYTIAFGYLMAVFLSLAVIIIYKRIYPLERSLCFLVLALNLFFVNMCYDLARRYLSVRRATVVLCFFVLLKIAGSVRMLYWDRFALRNDLRVKDYHVVQAYFPALSRLRPASWQVMASEDYYTGLLRLYLDREGRRDPVIYSRAAALGEVIFVSDSVRQLQIPLKGYRPWAGQEKKGSLPIDYMTIYVSDELLKR